MPVVDKASILKNSIVYSFGCHIGRLNKQTGLICPSGCLMFGNPFNTDLRSVATATPLNTDYYTALAFAERVMTTDAIKEQKYAVGISTTSPIPVNVTPTIWVAPGGLSGLRDAIAYELPPLSISADDQFAEAQSEVGVGVRAGDCIFVTCRVDANLAGVNPRYWFSMAMK